MTHVLLVGEFFGQSPRMMGRTSQVGSEETLLGHLSSFDRVAQVRLKLGSADGFNYIFRQVRGVETICS